MTLILCEESNCKVIVSVPTVMKQDPSNCLLDNVIHLPKDGKKV